MSPPSPDVIQAFSLKGIPEPIVGGRGLCYMVDQFVFKPAEDDIEAQWIAELVTSLLLRSPISYRLAVPLPTADQPGRFVFRGWTASSFVPGIGVEGRIEDKFNTSRAFHADLGELVHKRPDAVGRPSNRFNKADRVTWDEATLDEVGGVNEEMLALFQPLLDRLEQVRRPLPRGVPYQIIHGDLGGNMLFEENGDMPPAIIDLTLYWRPAEYANAIIVADELAWLGKGRDLVELYGTDDLRMQLLVRAMYYRCVTFAIDTDFAWVQRCLPKGDFARAVEIVCSFLDIGD